MRYKLIKGGLLKKNKLPIFVIQKIGSNMSCLADSNNCLFFIVLCDADLIVSIHIVLLHYYITTLLQKKSRSDDSSQAGGGVRSEDTKVPHSFHFQRKC